MGKAIIIPNVNWSTRNFGKVTKSEIDIVGDGTITVGDTKTYTAQYHGNAVNASWSIEGNGVLSSTTGTSVTVTSTGVGSIYITAFYDFMGGEKTLESSSAYVSNGLVFYLDGKAKGNNEGKWTDLVGNVQWTNYGATSVTDGWHFANGAYMLDDGTMDFYTHANCTVEVCIDSETSGSNYFIFAGAGGGVIGCFVYSYKGTYSVNSSWFIIKGIENQSASSRGSLPYRSVIQGDGKFTMSLAGNNTSGYWNGVAKSSYNVAYTSNGTAIIGKRISKTAGGDSFPFTGTIHSIRIYNRLLTNAEILSNQRIDNERFNLGLTI